MAIHSRGRTSPQAGADGAAANAAQCVRHDFVPAPSRRGSSVSKGVPQRTASGALRCCTRMHQFATRGTGDLYTSEGDHMSRRLMHSLNCRVTKCVDGRECRAKVVIAHLLEQRHGHHAVNVHFPRRRKTVTVVLPPPISGATMLYIPTKPETMATFCTPRAR
jgi:hypothetical protein